MPGEGNPVQVQPGDIHGAVGRQLGAVDQDARAVVVGELGQLGDRPDLPGHVGGAGHRQQHGLLLRGPGQRLIDVSEELRRARRDGQFDR